MTRTATTFLFAGMRWKTRFIPFRVGQPFRIGRTVSLWVLSVSRKKLYQIIRKVTVRVEAFGLVESGADPEAMDLQDSRT